jgi:hypothetical protein
VQQPAENGWLRITILEIAAVTADGSKIEEE